MKTLVLTFSLLFSLLPVSATLLAAPIPSDNKKEPFKDNYQVLEKRTRSKTPMVTEMYSVYCGACYMWEKDKIPELKEKLKNKKIPFQQGHVTFMGKYGKQATAALAIAHQLGNYEPLKKALFERIRRKKQDWSSEADFFATLKASGLTEKDYNLHKNSMLVLGRLSSWSEYQQSLEAVPSFIVNNKYLIKTQGIKSTDQFVELIEYLLKQP